MIRGAGLLLRTSLVLSIVAASACVSALTNDYNNGCWHACSWFHGVTTASDSLRLYMEAHRAMTDRIEEALLGRRRARVEFDTATAVYWLSDSGRPEYLRTLLRFAGHADGDVATFSIYGLARHAGDNAVRARLLEVYASAPSSVRNNMAATLATVNDSSARSLLAVIDRRDLRPDTIQMIEIALSEPPLQAGKGRWPCLPNVPPPWTGKCPR
jgi:hypothetical protein